MTTIQQRRVAALHAIDATSLPTLAQANAIAANATDDDNLIRSYRAAGHLRAYADAAGVESGDTTAEMAAVFLADFMHMCDALQAAAEQHDDRDEADQAYRLDFDQIVEAARVHYNAERAL